MKQPQCPNVWVKPCSSTCRKGTNKVQSNIRIKFPVHPQFVQMCYSPFRFSSGKSLSCMHVAYATDYFQSHTPLPHVLLVDIVVCHFFLYNNYGLGICHFSFIIIIKIAASFSNFSLFRHLKKPLRSFTVRVSLSVRVMSYSPPSMTIFWR
jgi:hypothetical protein